MKGVRVCLLDQDGDVVEQAEFGEWDHAAIRDFVGDWVIVHGCDPGNPFPGLNGGVRFEPVTLPDPDAIKQAGQVERVLAA